jgi:hypothetical protein
MMFSVGSSSPFPPLSFYEVVEKRIFFYKNCHCLLSSQRVVVFLVAPMGNNVPRVCKHSSQVVYWGSDGGFVGSTRA